MDGDEDLRDRPFAERRARLETFVARLNDPRIDVSPLVPFDTWDALTAARADPASAGAGADAEAVEGIMLKRRDAPTYPGRPKGPVVEVEARSADRRRRSDVRPARPRQALVVLFRLHVRGLDQGRDGDELVPVGKAYFGFTDEELLQIDRYVRRNTKERFGPVREVVHEPDQGLVFEVAFEGLQRSTRHKSGLAMRFPRINRLRWDKPPREADRLETLEKMLGGIEGRPPPCAGSRAGEAQVR